MEGLTEIISPREEANRCLLLVAREHNDDLTQQYRLKANRAGDRRQLGELLIDRLVRDCPILQALAPGEIESKLRYSDLPLTGRAMAPVLKFPPPDAPELTAGERSGPLRVTGTLLARPGSGKIRLQTSQGELQLRISPRLLRAHPLTKGDRVSLLYRREWQKGGDRILLVVTKIL